jgi:hypothetical protein
VRATHGAALLMLALATLPATNEARADEPAAGKSEEASQRFKSGVTFYKDKDFAAALVEFKRAYELLPNYNVLYNLGQTARELKDYAAAVKAFEQYLRDGGSKISVARHKEVAAAVEGLRRKVGTLHVVSPVDGAEIAVDDVLVGAAPLEPVLANAGRRKVSARLTGYAPAQQVVEVAATEETTVRLDLVKLDAGPPKVDPAAPPKRPPPLVVWVTLSATAACALAAGVTGGLAVSAHGTLKDALATFPGNPQAITDAQGRTRTFAVTTDVLIGVTVAGAVATTALFLLAPRVAEKVTVGVSPKGVAVGGVF